jgi:hypothetical protein
MIDRLVITLAPVDSRGSSAWEVSFARLTSLIGISDTYITDMWWSSGYAALYRLQPDSRNHSQPSSLAWFVAQTNKTQALI